MASRSRPGGRRISILIAGIGLIAAAVALVVSRNPKEGVAEPPRTATIAPTPGPARAPTFRRRDTLGNSGFALVISSIKPWPAEASLREISKTWERPGHQLLAPIDKDLASAQAAGDAGKRIALSLAKVMLYNSEGNAKESYNVLEQAREQLGREGPLAETWLYTVIYLKGVVGLRLGENENCIDCRGESSCILPIAPAAVHVNPRGSRLAIQHFTEYLARFPDDFEVRWLLNLAYMTLGEYPGKVPEASLIAIDSFRNSEFDIGKFRDVGALAGVNHLNQSGGAIMEDFDNDGLLDLAVTAIDPTEPMILYRNTGKGRFEDRSASAGVTDQLGGLVCYQTDYDNDGHMDIFIARGAWVPFPIRPSLLRNIGDGTFADVTEKAGLLDPLNSGASAWADYDNDGVLDLFIGCERQPNRLYHNRGDGTFEEVAVRAGVDGKGETWCKGCTWIDYDNDRYPDLFLNYLNGTGHLYHNNRDGTFTDVSQSLGIDGPTTGFACWTWDFDNDGWLDVMATCYDRSLNDVVRGVMGLTTHQSHSNKLFRNKGGKGFEDATVRAGLDVVLAAMGCNYADFDNDGWLDMYFGTGDPSISTLVPNRMFRNVDGKRFAEITCTSGTGHLQKGHGVACGDYDRDGDIDIFIQMGGPINGDKYHNILFENPGQGNHALTVKLVGKKSNRPGIGARIKAETAGLRPLTIHRHVSSGSSFGANPLEQSIGMGRATRLARLEIFWPTSGTTQVFHDVDADQIIEITEFAEGFRTLGRVSAKVGGDR
jgi:hypothetical protein